MADSSNDSLRWLMEAVAESPARINEHLAAGMMVGRYRLILAIGRGGFGTVFKAVDTELGREVALKLLRRHGERANARLLREAQAMARLSHPNVLTVYDVGTFEWGVFIAMELVDGGTLSTWLREPRPWKKIVEVFLHAGRGLEAAHQAGLVHRDFKPDNVLIGRSENVRVSDFGVARMMDTPNDSAETQADAPLSLTHTGTLLGTPAYMAPEQMAGEPSDARADVFSFSVALYEALYHERPFRGDDLVSLRAAVAEDRVTPPSRPSELPPPVRRALLRGLRASPGDRHQTMASLLADLERALSRRNRRMVWAAAIAATALAAGLIARHQPAPPATAGAPLTAVTTLAPAVTAPPKPNPDGTVLVRVNVPTARIELDGEVIAASAGSAQVSVEPAREHRLKVSAAGYRATQRGVVVGAGATAATTVVLERLRPAAPIRATTLPTTTATIPATATPAIPATAPPATATATTATAPPATATATPPRSVNPNAAIDPYHP